MAKGGNLKNPKIKFESKVLSKDIKGNAQKIGFYANGILIGVNENVYEKYSTDSRMNYTNALRKAYRSNLNKDGFRELLGDDIYKTLDFNKFPLRVRYDIKLTFTKVKDIVNYIYMDEKEAKEKLDLLKDKNKLNFIVDDNGQLLMNLKNRGMKPYNTYKEAYNYYMEYDGGYSGRLKDGGYMAKGGEIADIDKMKKSLIAKAKSKGLYEDFGQKEVRQLEDKYGYTRAIQNFDNWAMNFDLSQMANGGYMAKGGIVDVEDIKNKMYNLFNAWLGNYISDEELVNSIKRKLGTKYFRFFKGDTIANDWQGVQNSLKSKNNRDFLKENMEISLEEKSLEIYNSKNEKLEYGGYMANGGYVAVAEKDGYWTIMSKPTSKEKAQKQIDLGVPRGEVGKVVTLEQAKAHKKVIGREYLADGGYMAKGGIVEHGLKEGDHIKMYFDNVVVVENDGKKFVVNLNKGKRWTENEWFTQGGINSKLSKMAHGGETHRAEDPEVEVDEDEMKVIRGYSDDEAYEYAKGGMTLKAGDIVEATTGVKLKVMDFKPDFGGRALVQRIDEFGEGLKPAWMPLTKFKLPKLI